LRDPPSFALWKSIPVLKKKYKILNISDSRLDLSDYQSIGKGNKQARKYGKDGEKMLYF
jgi:hypothetical protein